MIHQLDHIVWQTLTGTHARFAQGSGGARRFASGFSPIVAFEDPGRPDFESLSAVCAPGEHFYCDGFAGACPDGWRIDAESHMHKMLWQAPAPADDAAPEAVRLGPAHVDQAVRLAALTRPGPFGPRTIELGEYWGVFDGARLVAMAGERFHAGTLREISGVCTLPEFQGRGLARRLMLKLVQRQMARGETPFLHVMRENVGAQRLYARMGFASLRESVVRVLAPV